MDESEGKKRTIRCYLVEVKSVDIVVFFLLPRLPVEQ
jgi:hypothetical protein